MSITSSPEDPAKQFVSWAARTLAIYLNENTTPNADGNQSLEDRQNKFAGAIRGIVNSMGDYNEEFDQAVANGGDGNTCIHHNGHTKANSSTMGRGYNNGT